MPLTRFSYLYILSSLPFVISILYAQFNHQPPSILLFNPSKVNKRPASKLQPPGRRSIEDIEPRRIYKVHTHTHTHTQQRSYIANTRRDHIPYYKLTIIYSRIFPNQKKTGHIAKIKCISQHL